MSGTYPPSQKDGSDPPNLQYTCGDTDRPTVPFTYGALTRPLFHIRMLVMIRNAIYVMLVHIRMPNTFNLLYTCGGTDPPILPYTYGSTDQVNLPYTCGGTDPSTVPFTYPGTDTSNLPYTCGGTDLPNL